jgi:glycosyltransferase involved in cell wall biosynthesis
MKALLITAAKMASGAEMITKNLYAGSSHTLIVASGNPEVLTYFETYGFNAYKIKGLLDLSRQSFMSFHWIRLPLILEHIRQCVNAHRPDYILVTNLISLLYVSLANIRKVPIVLHVHDHYTQSPRHALIAKRLRHVPSVALCVSRGVYNEMLKLNFDAAKLSVIHNGIASSAFDVTAKLSKVGVLPLKMIFVGLLVPEKGPHLILEALHQLPKELKGKLELTLVGSSAEAGYQTRLEHLAASCGVNIRFVGKQTNARQWIYESDVLIHASPSSDSFPTVVLEGMHEGCVVIAAQHTGAREMIVHGQTGFLLNPNEPQAFVDTLTFLLANPAQVQAVATASYYHAKAHLSLESFQNHFFAILGEYLGIPSAE